MMRKIWSSRSWEEYLAWQNEDRRILKRINAIIKDIERNSFLMEAVSMKIVLLKPQISPNTNGYVFLLCIMEDVMDIIEVKQKSMAIRKRYHELEDKLHGAQWSVEEDALAFLTDAGLVGRLTMDRQGRWPSDDADLLPSKIGECVWWLAVLAERMDLNFEQCIEQFLNERLNSLK